MHMNTLSQPITGNHWFCLSCPKFQPKDSILAWEVQIKPNSLGKSWRAPWRPVAGNHQFLLSCPNFLAKDSIFDWEVPIKPNKTQFSETVLEDSMPSRSWKPSFWILQDFLRELGFTAFYWDLSSKNWVFCPKVGTAQAKTMVSSFWRTWSPSRLPLRFGFYYVLLGPLKHKLSLLSKK